MQGPSSGTGRTFLEYPWRMVSTVRHVTFEVERKAHDTGITDGHHLTWADSDFCEHIACSGILSMQ